MGAITALFARKVLDAAGPGFDRDALMAGLGFAPDDAPGVSRMVPDTAYYALLETIARRMEDATAFPVAVGRSMLCDEYGAFGLAWKTAPTLRGSFERAERYWRLLSSVSEYELRPDPRGAFFLLHREGPRRLGMRLSNEATLASVTAIIRQISPAPFAPIEVHCKHEAPASTSAQQAYFGSEVIHGSAVDGLLVPSEALERANRLGDPAISRFLEPHLAREMEQVAPETSFEQVLLRRISDRLSEGPPRAAEMARAMGMSERTLHRRLSETGQSFQAVLERARRRLAEGLLVQSDHSIAEIAFLTGFSEQSSFTRAFRRWSDQTPAAFRGARRRA